MGRPTKENSLTPEAVIAAAIVCLDQEGEAALGVNRVARQLGIKPPAIYKHLEGNAGLQRAVALAIWRDYLATCQQQTSDISKPQQLLQVGAQRSNTAAFSPKPSGKFANWPPLPNPGLAPLELKKRAPDCRI
jgi:AcrR family transcriptional regulator